MARDFKSNRFDKKSSGKKFGGKPAPWSKPSSHNSEFDRPTMHTATCHACGTTCEVPFKPNGSKPVFCLKCFDRSETGGPKKFGKPSFESRRGTDSVTTSKTDEQLRTINAKLDTILKMLESER